MLIRGALFMAWALLGAVLSYGALYVLSPYGLVIVTICALVAFALPGRGGSRWPECLGLLAGPGVFCFLVAASSDEPVVWTLAGAAIAAVALTAYALVGRSRCHALHN